MFLNSIAITIDNNYVQHACVMLRSLDVNIPSAVNVYCIYDGLSHRNISRMRREFKKSHINLHFVAFDNTLLPPQLPLKSTDHVTSATFFRIWLPYLLKDLKQVLFMDSDIVIDGDISEILNLDVSDHPLAAVPEPGVFTDKKHGLGMRDDQLYINAGVILFNLDYFRQKGLTEQISEFLHTHPQLCELWDQDAINATIKGNFYRLDYKFNVQTSFYPAASIDLLLHKAIKNPVVVHYTGGGDGKPWFYRSKHPARHLYYKYLRLTSFRFYYPPDLPRSWRIFRKIRFMLLHV
ncbi:glycosyltransferase family 8 protein [Mucilaginibacter terrigena]|uniref:Glycosyltransferase family 8 protein n=1 Tax=Mucilaginibacter terrigena TaxID=2492395 RepID=A0A4Q5LPF2_9SPHI|nr:glycosyltransferase family 8 protein [Mucilaginibacter terrigena]RYU91274.1 glycosyltransferase family 8 protein [Mucilaginibacter terrigena]